jgi:hypothetical protein
MPATVAEGIGATNAGDHATTIGDPPDGAGPAPGGRSVSEGGSPVQTIRAAAIALPFVALAILVAFLSAILGRGG